MTVSRTCGPTQMTYSTHMENNPMTDLSPAAQAKKVLAAYHEEAIDYIEEWGSFRHKRGMAAALLAAVNQVVPEDGLVSTLEDIIQQSIRSQLLAIAAELAGTPTTPAES